MEFTSSAPPAPAIKILGLSGVVQGIALSPDEQKKILAGRTVIDSINATTAATCKPAFWNGEKSALADAERAAYQKLIDDPTPANAEIYHRSYIRFTEIPVSEDTISEAVETARAREQDALFIVANAIMDRAQVVIDAEAAAHSDAISGTLEHTVFGGIEDAWCARIRDINIAIQIERDTAKKAPLEWLLANGFYQADSKGKKSC